MWNIAGLALALAVGTVAWLRSRSPGATFYERDVYGMNALTHRRYAIASLVFALVFAAGLLFANVPTVPLLGVYTVVAILYVASFVRGATGEDE